MSKGKLFQDVAGEAGCKGWVTKCHLYHIKEFGPFLKGPDVTLENFKQDNKLTILLLRGVKPGARKLTRKINVKCRMT